MLFILALLVFSNSYLVHATNKRESITSTRDAQHPKNSVLTAPKAEPSDLIQALRFSKKNRIDVRINNEFKKAYLRDDFFVEYDEDIDLTALDYSIVTLPFIMNVISLVWISGKEYYIDSMDQDVYDSLERINMLFKLWYPRTQWNGRLIPRKMIASHNSNCSTAAKVVKESGIKPHAAKQGPETIAILFSGGIDSLTASYKNRDKKQLLITAWGQSCLPLDHPEIWFPIKEKILDFAKGSGYTNSFLRSNYYYFLNLKKLSTLSPDILSWRIETIEDIGWAGLTAPILISKGIPRLHIGSSDSIHRFYPTACNPYIDDNLRFAGLTFKQDQFELTRHDKISYIIDLCRKQSIKKPELIICQKRGGIINCGICEKCCTTLLSFLSLEEDPRDYGYSTTPEESLEASKRMLTNPHLSSAMVWQCEDIQNSGKACKNKLCDLSWLSEIDIRTLQPYDLAECGPVDLKKLAALFPEIALT